MQTFTGWEYMLIDLANQYGHDKMLFEERIEWATNNLKTPHMLETFIGSAENKPLFIKAVMAIRKVQRGEPTGHVIGLDAVCSGIQIMSALTGCIKGARATGLIDPNRRADAYSELQTLMQQELGTGFTVVRKAAKEALMTMYYGSKAKPIEIFGKDTPELNAFYMAAFNMAPGAWEVLQDLLASWQPYALVHEWKLPDGFDARVKVMKKIDGDDSRSKIEVDELGHATFTYEYYINEGSKNGLSNVANVVHSVDAYVLRSMHRRCNYDVDTVEIAAAYIAEALQIRAVFDATDKAEGKLEYYIQQYERSGMPDIVILPYINSLEDALKLNAQHLESLQTIISSMLVHEPFAIITIHDEFKASPVNLNYMRQHYINIFAELAESNLLSDLLSQIHGTKGEFIKLSKDLPAMIRQSNYMLS